MRSVATVLFLVVLATVVATFARRLEVPAPSLLVVAGVVVGLTPGAPAVRVAPEVVSLVVLPILLYAAAEDLSPRDLRAMWRPVAVLAIGLVVTSAAAVGIVAWSVAPLSWGAALVLGAVLASTDPVAVSALGRGLALPARVRTLVQAESLFNDATSLLLFRLAVAAVVSTGSFSWARSATELVRLAGGGLVAGAGVAAVTIFVRRRTEEPVVEIAISLVAPYAAYVGAEALGGSGVTAVVVAGVVVGTQSTRVTSPRIRIQLHAFSQAVVFLLESVVFAIIGLQLPRLVRDVGSDVGWIVPALAIAGALLVTRTLWVLPVSVLLHRRSMRDERPAFYVAAVVSWAGARGVVPLAAALSIPLVTASGQPLGRRDLIVLVATSVIVISLVVQGFTLAPIARWARIAVEPETARDEDVLARVRVARAALAQLDVIAGAEAVPRVVADDVRRELGERLQRIESPVVAADRLLRKELLAIESAELTRLYEDGEISDGTRRRVQRSLDLEAAALGED